MCFISTKLLPYIFNVRAINTLQKDINVLDTKSAETNHL